MSERSETDEGLVRGERAFVCSTRLNVISLQHFTDCLLTALLERECACSRT